MEESGILKTQEEITAMIMEMLLYEDALMLGLTCKRMISILRKTKFSSYVEEITQGLNFLIPAKVMSKATTNACILIRNYEDLELVEQMQISRSTFLVNSPRRNDKYEWDENVCFADDHQKTVTILPGQER